jgi:hypothetical protein
VLFVDPSGHVLVATLGISSTLSGGFRSARISAINRALVKELGCGLVEFSVESIIREGVYVFLADIDSLRPGKPYAGRSIDIERRLRQHVGKRISDLNKGLLLKLHLPGFTARQIALIEDIVIDAIGGAKSRGGSSANRIGGYRPKYKGEREALKKAIRGLCK